MSDEKVSVSVPLFGAIGLVLVILKIGGVAPVSAWSWWLVTMPFWIGIVVVLAICAVLFIGAGLVELFKR